MLLTSILTLLASTWAASPTPSATPSVAPSPPAPLKASLASRDLWQKGVQIDHIEDSIIHFKPVAGAGDAPTRLPSPLETWLHDIQYLGALLSPDQLPVLLMAARPCTQCTEEKQIYAVRIDGARTTHFVYPGRILDPKTRAVLFEARSFFGKCRPQNAKADLYVVYQRERLDRRRALQTSVFVAAPNRDFLEEKLHERQLPGIKHTLAQVKRRQCWEISGRNRLMLRKPINLRPKRDGDEDDQDDEDEDEEKSPRPNESDVELPSAPTD